jgi:hypothetical protein
MKITALALALSFGLASSMAAFAQTATPATPATPAKPAAQAQTKPVAKLDCAKTENKAKAECKVTNKATDKKS